MACIGADLFCSEPALVPIMSLARRHKGNDSADGILNAMKRAFLYLTLSLTLVPGAVADEALDLGLRRELFVDDFLIEELDGASQVLHRPTPREIAIVHDAPCEGNISYYHTVFRDGDIYRMYYRGGHHGARGSHPEATGHQVVCYAESADGKVWSKPNLGLHEFAGNKDNNIIWTGIGQHNFAPFLDSNPDCPPESRYKAIGHGKGGLYVFQSADGIRWSLIKDKPVITRGAFDSQNLAFYDNVRGLYVDFHRGFEKGVRAIMTCTSEDFVTWTEPEWVSYTDDLNQHLYTNQTSAYPRAPHIFLSFPKRFLPKRNLTRHPGPGASDILLMSSRDGKIFHRWNEAFLRPGPQRERWVNRNNFVAWGIVETASHRNGVADEFSFYSMEGYYSGDDCRMRRYTLRPDGFVSIHAPLAGGEMLTRALTFDLPDANAPRTVIDKQPQPIRAESKAPIRGTGSLTFDSTAILTLGDTSNLGRQATLAVAVRNVPAGHRRLFSTYDGGKTTPGELYFDINAAAPITRNDGYAIRFNYNGTLVGAKLEDIGGDWSSGKDARAVHHLAATWDDGVITLYFDGKRVAEGGEPGAGDLAFRMGDLHFGEDYAGTSLSNEPFLGTIDDLTVLRRALSSDEVASLAETGSAGGAAGIQLTFDDTDRSLADTLTEDGAQPVTGPVANQPANVSLLLNFATSAAGSLRCEIQDADTGTPIPGFTLADSDELFGDSLDRPMTWNSSSELKSLVGKAIRLRFELRDADLYALRFGR